MSEAIVKWLGGNDTGSSSKAIALTALGVMPDHPTYPSDSSDFGRCRRLLVAAPEAKAGLDHLAKHGGEVWGKLIERWGEIDAAYLVDERAGWENSRTCYDIMKSIINPVEDRDPTIIRFGNNAKIKFGR